MEPGGSLPARSYCTTITPADSESMSDAIRAAYDFCHDGGHTQIQFIPEQVGTDPEIWQCHVFYYQGE